MRLDSCLIHMFINCRFDSWIEKFRKGYVSFENFLPAPKIKKKNRANVLMSSLKKPIFLSYNTKV